MGAGRTWRQVLEKGMVVLEPFCIWGHGLVSYKAELTNRAAVYRDKRDCCSALMSSNILFFQRLSYWFRMKKFKVVTNETSQ